MRWRPRSESPAGGCTTWPSPPGMTTRPPVFHLGGQDSDGGLDRPRGTVMFGRTELDKTQASGIGPDDVAEGLDSAAFAAGCFWGVEEFFRAIPGVLDAISGYEGGEVGHPSYEQVCSGRTGHAEAVLVTFDPSQVSFETLLEEFWRHHDPTTLNRQGPDHGTQYRSVSSLATRHRRMRHGPPSTSIKCDS